MNELDLLLRAHEANETLGLGLTPAQITRALDTHEGKRPRPKTGRRPHADPTAETALANLEGR